MSITDDEFTTRPDLVRKRARSIAVTRTIAVIVVIYCVSTITFMLIATIIGFNQRKILLDCTTPSGECFERSRQSTGKAVAGINDYTKAVIILTVACGEEPGIDTRKEIEACVTEGLRP